MQVQVIAMIQGRVDRKERGVGNLGGRWVEGQQGGRDRDGETGRGKFWQGQEVGRGRWRGLD